MSELSHYLSLGVGVICILIGYALGRNSAERPIVNPEIKIPSLKKDPTDEPLGDVFNDAMRGDSDARYPMMEEK